MGCEQGRVTANRIRTSHGREHLASGSPRWAPKVAASLASLGTPAHFLHPAEAIHGDLGRIRAHDLVLAFSFSGASEMMMPPACIDR